MATTIERSLQSTFTASNFTLPAWDEFISLNEVAEIDAINDKTSFSLKQIASALIFEDKSQEAYLDKNLYKSILKNRTKSKYGTKSNKELNEIIDKNILVSIPKPSFNTLVRDRGFYLVPKEIIDKIDELVEKELKIAEKNLSKAKKEKTLQPIEKPQNLSPESKPKTITYATDRQKQNILDIYSIVAKVYNTIITDHPNYAAQLETKTKKSSEITQEFKAIGEDLETTRLNINNFTKSDASKIHNLLSNYNSLLNNYLSQLLLQENKTTTPRPTEPVTPTENPNKQTLALLAETRKMYNTKLVNPYTSTKFKNNELVKKINKVGDVISKDITPEKIKTAIDEDLNKINKTLNNQKIEILSIENELFNHIQKAQKVENAYYSTLTQYQEVNKLVEKSAKKENYTKALTTIGNNLTKKITPEFIEKSNDAELDKTSLVLSDLQIEINNIKADLLKSTTPVLAQTDKKEKTSREVVEEIVKRNSSTFDREKINQEELRIKKEREEILKASQKAEDIKKQETIIRSSYSTPLPRKNISLDQYMNFYYEKLKDSGIKDMDMLNKYSQLLDAAKAADEKYKKDFLKFASDYDRAHKKPASTSYSTSSNAYSKSQSSYEEIYQNAYQREKQRLDDKFGPVGSQLNNSFSNIQTFSQPTTPTVYTTSWYCPCKNYYYTYSVSKPSTNSYYSSYRSVQYDDSLESYSTPTYSSNPYYRNTKRNTYKPQATGKTIAAGK